VQIIIRVVKLQKLKMKQSLLWNHCIDCSTRLYYTHCIDNC